MHKMLPCSRLVLITFVSLPSLLAFSITADFQDRYSQYLDSFPCSLQNELIVVVSHDISYSYEWKTYNKRKHTTKHVCLFEKDLLILMYEVVFFFLDLAILSQDNIWSCAIRLWIHTFPIQNQKQLEDFEVFDFFLELFNCPRLTNWFL